MPPEIDFYFKEVAELIPWWRKTSSVAMPASCSFKIAMICFPLYLLRFTSSDSLCQALPKRGSISGEHVSSQLATACI